MRNFRPASGAKFPFTAGLSSTACSPIRRSVNLSFSLCLVWSEPTLILFWAFFPMTAKDSLFWSINSIWRILVADEMTTRPLIELIPARTSCLSRSAELSPILGEVDPSLSVSLIASTAPSASSCHSTRLTNRSAVNCLLRFLKKACGGHVTGFLPRSEPIARP